MPVLEKKLYTISKKRVRRKWLAGCFPWEVVLIDCGKEKIAYDECIRIVKSDVGFRPTDGNACARNSWFKQQFKKVKHHFCLAA